jgi:hypothetical protein
MYALRELLEDAERELGQEGERGLAGSAAGTSARGGVQA